MTTPETTFVSVVDEDTIKKVERLPRVRDGGVLEGGTCVTSPDRAPTPETEPRHGLRDVGSSAFWCLCGQAFKLPSRNHGSFNHPFRPGEFDKFNAHVREAAQESPASRPFVVRQFEGQPWVPLHEAARLHDAVQESGLTIAALRNQIALEESPASRPPDDYPDLDAVLPLPKPRSWRLGESPASRPAPERPVCSEPDNHCAGMWATGRHCRHERPASPEARE